MEATDAPSTGAFMGALPSLSPPEAALTAMGLDIWDAIEEGKPTPFAPLGGMACDEARAASAGLRYAKQPLAAGGAGDARHPFFPLLQAAAPFGGGGGGGATGSAAPLARALAKPVDEGVGDVNDVATGGCDPWGCPWDGGDGAAALTVEPREVVIAFEDLAAWIDDVKKIARLDLGAAPGKEAEGRCLLGYVWLQFGGAAPDFLASTSGLGGGAVHAITMLSRSRKLYRERPGRFGFVHDLIEQLSLCKYKGRPHFGKSSDR